MIKKMLVADKFIHYKIIFSYPSWCFENSKLDKFQEWRYKADVKYYQVNLTDLNFGSMIAEL